MKETMDIPSAANESSAVDAPCASGEYVGTSVCVVGGQRMMRSAICASLTQAKLQVQQVIEKSELSEAMAAGDARLDTHALVLLLTGGVSRELELVRKILDANPQLPLVVLSDQVSRGQVYAALRLGAKAFVNLDSEPGELLTGIQMAIHGKVYLSADAAQLLVTDVSGAMNPSANHHWNGGPSLSKREMEIVALLCEGLSSKAIATRLHLSCKTVENHRYNIYRKCEVESIAGLIRYAIQNGLAAI